MNIEQTLQLLDIQEVTTRKQKKNGTREFKLPVRDQYGAAIHVASYKNKNKYEYKRNTRKRVSYIRQKYSSNSKRQNITRHFCKSK